MKDKSTRGLLKSKKYCFIAQVATLIVNIGALATIIASIGVDTMTNASPAQVLTTAGIGLGLGAIGGTATVIVEKKEEKINEQLALNEQYERQI
ncbi:MAG: hypothetical protein IJX25_02930 [Clostridia bacterium]|nr:hypothetical protein [Clostridia bacterium]